MKKLLLCLWVAAGAQDLRYGDRDGTAMVVA